MICICNAMVVITKQRASVTLRIMHFIKKNELTSKIHTFPDFVRYNFIQQLCVLCNVVAMQMLGLCSSNVLLNFSIDTPSLLS